MSAPAARKTAAAWERASGAVRTEERDSSKRSLRLRVPVRFHARFPPSSRADRKASRRILPAGTARPRGSRCGLSPVPGRVRALPRHRVSRARKRHARSRGISQKVSCINSRGSASFQFNAHRTGRMTACLTCASLRNRPERSSPTALLNVCSGFTVEIPQLVSPTPVRRARVRVKVDNHAFSL